MFIKTTKNNKQYKLSIVIITKNEEKNIGRCIESLFEAIKDTPGVEIILVDSLSKDSTIEIAERYPINIIQLGKSFPLSPAAGQYLGILHAHGEYVQIMGGDMSIDKSWFGNALPILENDKGIAGVDGLYKESDSENSVVSRKLQKVFDNMKAGNIDRMGGCGLYRRSILNKVGPINPYILGDPETELSYRIFAAGYKLIRIPYCVITHYGYHEQHTSPVTEVVRRFKNKYYFGSGVTLRYSLHNKKLLLMHIKRMKLYFLFMVWVLFGFIALITGIVMMQRLAFYMWGFSTVSFLVLFFVKKKDINGVFYSILNWTFWSIGIISGFLKTPKDPKTYPTNVKVIKIVN